MNIKFFYPNKEGNIEFTRDELERLINDVYEEGQTNAKNDSYFEGPKSYNESTHSRDYYYCTDTDSIGKIILERVKGE